MTDLRLSLDENMRPRGFGYIELKDESMVERAIEELSGLDIGKIDSINHFICYLSLHDLVRECCNDCLIVVDVTWTAFAYSFCCSYVTVLCVSCTPSPCSHHVSVSQINQRDIAIL